MVDLDTTKDMFFTVTGTIAIPKDAVTVLAANGEICGFEIGDKQYRLVMALEVESHGVLKYLSTDDEMSDHGCQVTDYERTDFVEMTDKDSNLWL